MPCLHAWSRRHCAACCSGATAWLRELGDGQRIYFMAPVRYWHWLGGNARPGEGGEPATYDIPLAYSRDGFNFTYLGERMPFARPTRDGSIGVSRLWLAPPIRFGDEELYYLTRGNMNEVSGSPCLQCNAMKGRDAGPQRQKEQNKASAHYIRHAVCSHHLILIAYYLMDGN
jgi:hypothetical protein